MSDTYSEDIPAPDSSLAQPWKVMFWISVFILLSGVLQLLIPYPVDDDTAYHLAVGRMISKHGILNSFFPTSFTWFAGRYADNEVLFHLLFVPLAKLEWIAAARIAGTIAGAALLSSMYVVLRSEKIEFAALWALLPLTSVTFLAPFVLVRPQLLSVALVFVFFWAVSREKLGITLLCAVLYPWACEGFLRVAVVLLVTTETSRFLAERKIAWKPAAVSAAGFAIGMALHPNSANLMGMNLTQVREIFFGQIWNKTIGPHFGNELLPFPFSQWSTLLIMNVLMTVAAAALSMGKSPRTVISIGAILTAATFGLLILKSPDFLIYFVPFSVCALACSARSIGWRWFAPGLFGASLLLLAITGLEPLTTLVPPQIDPADVTFLQQNIPVGATVFNCECDVTGALAMALPQRKLVVALEPALLCLKNPEEYKLWYHVTRSAIGNASEIIRIRFGSRFVLAPAKGEFAKFFDELYADPAVRTVTLSEKWVFFDLNHGRGEAK